LFPEDLKKFIGDKKGKGPKIELVFVNACHSEPFGKIFLDAGIKRVICVQADLQIADIVARKFAEIFYKLLFNGYSFEKSFNRARELVKTVLNIGHI